MALSKHTWNLSGDRCGECGFAPGWPNYTNANCHGRAPLSALRVHNLYTLVLFEAPYHNWAQHGMGYKCVDCPESIGVASMTPACNVPGCAAGVMVVQPTINQALYTTKPLINPTTGFVSHLMAFNPVTGIAHCSNCMCYPGTGAHGRSCMGSALNAPQPALQALPHTWVINGNNGTPHCSACGMAQASLFSPTTCPGPGGKAGGLNPPPQAIGKTISFSFSLPMPVCECGAQKGSGIQPYKMGHSGWCPVKARE